MKATELMIGDLVRKLERGGHSIPVKIIAIYEHNADYETRDGHTGCMSLNGYEPIPLTNKILEKNGFEYGFFPESKTTEMQKNTTLLATYHKGSKTVFVAIDEPNFKLTNACVLYVHELQHLFNMARIKKEVVL